MSCAANISRTVVSTNGLQIIHRTADFPQEFHFILNIRNHERHAQFVKLRATTLHPENSIGWGRTNDFMTTTYLSSYLKGPLLNLAAMRRMKSEHGV